jgi:hypothetical protein
MLAVSIANCVEFSIILKAPRFISSDNFHIFTQNEMFIIALKIDHSFLGRDIETRLIISTTTSTQLALMR